MKPLFLSLKKDVPADSYWDQSFLKDILKSIEKYETDRQVVVIPGAYQGDIIPEINQYLAQFDKVLVFVTSDEEGKFNCKHLVHKDIIHYCEYGNCDRFFPLGYTSNTRRLLKEEGFTPISKKKIGFFFSGQTNTPLRTGIIESLQEGAKEDDLILGTNGFAQGLEQWNYYHAMAQAKGGIVLPGNISPDSFRFYEYLEAQVITLGIHPLVQNFYTKYFGNEDFDSLWWMRKKAEIRRQVMKDLGIQEKLTVVVPTSYIPSHPSTEIIEETLSSIRYHTDAPILITIDELRPEYASKEDDYYGYIEKLLWKCNFEYENIVPFMMPKHTHQVGMMRKALEWIDTPYILYVEHDTPLVKRDIDFAYLYSQMENGYVNMVRFHYDVSIHESHQHMLVPEKNRSRLVATKQWSQRPHLALTDFYRFVMGLFSPHANCFIEDFIHGKCQYDEFDNWKTFIYSPSTDIKFSYHLDGRAGNNKFDGIQVW